MKPLKDQEIQALQRHTIQEPDLGLSSLYADDDLCQANCKTSLLDRSPSITDILASIPKREDIEELHLIPGLFFLTSYMTEEEIIKYKELPLSTSDIMLGSKHVHEDVEQALRRYHSFAQKYPGTVLKAIVNAVPIVIAAHRTTVDNALSSAKDLFANLEISINVDSLWDIPYTTVRYLYEELIKRQSTQLSLIKLSYIREIDRFRSASYNLQPYFHIELQFLKDIKTDLFDTAVKILDRAVSERFLIHQHQNHYRTHIPSNCIKLMSFLARTIFNGLSPCTALSLYDMSNARNSSYSPILSLQTLDGKPLTRTHGEVYDAVCTLWSAGNRVISDQMIARTIWPRTDRHGGESFSWKELNTIGNVMNDLHEAQVKIDATNELQHYKRISKDDYKVLDGNLLQYSIVYTKLNGGRYLQRAYQIQKTPVLMEYSMNISQIFTGPISILEAPSNSSKIPRTLRYAQVRTYILERIHHFQSPAFQKEKHTILLNGIYKAYNSTPDNTVHITKKNRAAARKAAITILNTLKQLGIIYDYHVSKQGGEYHHFLIEMIDTNKDID